MPVSEAQLPVWRALDPVAALVHSPVVEAAEGDEVVQARLAALCPVPEMVAVQEPRAVAAGEAAALVSPGERPPKGGWDGARLSAHGERQTVSLEGNNGRITGEPPGRLRRERDALVQLAASLRIRGERLLLDQQDDLLAIAARALSSRMREGELGRDRERLEVRDMAGSGRRLRGAALLGLPSPTGRLPPCLERAQEEGALLGGEAATQEERAVLVPVVAEVGS